MTDDHGFPEKAPGWPYRRVEDADIAILAMKRLETFEETLRVRAQHPNTHSRARKHIFPLIASP